MFHDDTITDLRREIIALENENKMLREALREIVEVDSSSFDDNEYASWITAIGFMRHTARAALAAHAAVEVLRVKGGE